MECPGCKSDLLKRNGHTRNGKQNYRCIECGKQFVADPESNFISEKTRELVRRSLLEKVSLNGMGRIREHRLKHIYGLFVIILTILETKD